VRKVAALLKISLHGNFYLVKVLVGRNLLFKNKPASQQLFTVVKVLDCDPHSRYKFTTVKVRNDMDYLRVQLSDMRIVSDIMQAVADETDDYARRVAAYYHYGRMVERRVAAGEKMLDIQKLCGLSPNQHSYGTLIAKFEVTELETILVGENPPAIKKLAAMKRTAQKNPNPVGRRHKATPATPVEPGDSDGVQLRAKEAAETEPANEAEAASVAPSTYVVPFIGSEAPATSVEPPKPVELLTFTEEELAVIRTAVLDQYERAWGTLLHEQNKRRNQKQRYIDQARVEIQELEPVMKKLGISIDAEGTVTIEATDPEQPETERVDEEVEQMLSEPMATEQRATPVKADYKVIASDDYAEVRDYADRWERHSLGANGKVQPTNILLKGTKGAEEHVAKWCRMIG
jgi:hypothetical protein